MFDSVFGKNYLKNSTAQHIIDPNSDENILTGCPACQCASSSLLAVRISAARDHVIRAGLPYAGAALSVTTVSHLFDQPHFRSKLFTPLSDNAVSRWLDFMICSVDLVVMPHSPTSRASGDDTSIMTSWNSGV